ncbi:hypothetical protein HKX48_006843 [Thoreauomyces humboldtii]|nr:hypothetical protein HKX48_006843 [Thoreauomyces humboldtii]
MPKAEAKSTSAVKKAPGKKGTSLYNQYMKAELPKVKAKDTTLTHREAFKKCAENWGSAPENPKNKPAE